GRDKERDEMAKYRDDARAVLAKADGKPLESRGMRGDANGDGTRGTKVAAGFELDSVSVLSKDGETKKNPEGRGGAGFGGGSGGLGRTAGFGYGNADGHASGLDLSSVEKNGNIANGLGVESRTLTLSGATSNGATMGDGIVTNNPAPIFSEKAD